MNIRWLLSDWYSIKIYQEVAQKIESFFQQERRFYVLPYLPEKFRDRVVYFPYVESYVENFKSYNKKKNYEKIPDKVKDEIVKSYEQYKTSYKNTFSKLENNSRKYENTFELFCKKHNLYRDIDIIVAPSFVGSMGHYDIKDDIICVHPRFDRNLSEIFGLVLTAFVHFDYLPLEDEIAWNNDYYKMWWEKQEVTENLFKSDEFKSIFNDVDVKDAREILEDNTAGNLAVKSINYFKKLGFPIKSYVDGANQIQYLTKTEKNILNLLLNNRGRIVNYDQIASVMWKESENDKFSLYAISKIMERIRSKIKKNGIRPNLIHSQRGVGYVLYD